MTYPTRAIYRYLLADFVKVRYVAILCINCPFSNSGASNRALYTDSDIVKSLEKIEPCDFHQVLEVNGIKFTAYHAGHVLGAAMFLIEIAGVKVLYTGDFSREEDRHLVSAEMPPHRPDVLITESTYGIHIHDKREDRELRFTSLVHDIVSRGGRCLIPAFALGRAQELMLILDEYWSLHPELHNVPIYYASQLACKCMAVYQTFTSAMNEKIRNQLSNNNPFCFRFISNLRSRNHLDDSGPCVVLASPGMMQSGLSRELFENWCTDNRNGVIIAGYCVEGTLAKYILSAPPEISTMSGQKLPLKCTVQYISFSAHTDYQQTSAFIRELKPSHVVSPTLFIALLFCGPRTVRKGEEHHAFGLRLTSDPLVCLPPSFWLRKVAGDRLSHDPFLCLFISFTVVIIAYSIQFWSLFEIIVQRGSPSSPKASFAWTCHIKNLP